MTVSGRARHLRSVVAAFRLQLQLTARTPNDFLALVNAPLMTVVFLSVIRHAGRSDLAGYAVLAPAVIAVWAMAVTVSSEIVALDRQTGVMEALVATPGDLVVVVAGRVLAVTLVSLAALAESALVARLFFGIVVTVHHPALFAGTVAATAFATACTAAGLSCVFVLARSARTFQNTLTYPVYVLGGAIVPVALLPSWVQPACRLVYLSWATDLMRDSLAATTPAHVVPRLFAVVALGLLAGGAGLLGMRRILRHLRATGTIGWSV